MRRTLGALAVALLLGVLLTTAAAASPATPAALPSLPVAGMFGANLAQRAVSNAVVSDAPLCTHGAPCCQYLPPIPFGGGLLWAPSSYLSGPPTTCSWGLNFANGAQGLQTCVNSFFLPTCETFHVPAPGVITQLQVKVGSQTGPMRIEVVRGWEDTTIGGSGTCCTVLYQTKTFTPPANSTYTLPPVAYWVREDLAPDPGHGNELAVDQIVLTVLNLTTPIPINYTGNFDSGTGPSGPVWYPACQGIAVECLDPATQTGEFSFVPLVAGGWNATGPPAVAGLGAVSIGSGATVDSYDSTRGTGPVYSVTNQEKSASVLSNATVTLKTGSTVYGDVTGTTISGTGTVTGSKSAPAAPLRPPAVSACSPYSSSAGLNGTYSYSSATGDLAVTTGHTAHIAPGTYCFHSITLGTGAVLNTGAVSLTSKPVVIKLTGPLTASAGYLKNASPVPAKLQIVSSYTGSNGVSLLGGSAVNTSFAYLTVYAPGTNVALAGGTAFGALLGKTVTLAANTNLHFDTASLTTPWATTLGLCGGC
jgi:hypothetical protein